MGKMTARTLLSALISTAGASAPAPAKPPPGTDLTSPVHRWFEQQYSVKGKLCCDVSDGHLLEDKDVRMTRNGYEVNIDGTWFQVSPSQMRDAIRGGPNPTGHPIVWYTRTITPLPGAVISCFAPGTLF